MVRVMNGGELEGSLILPLLSLIILDAALSSTLKFITLSDCPLTSLSLNL